MRQDIRKILEMNRIGKVNDAQAAELLEALLVNPGSAQDSEEVVQGEDLLFGSPTKNITVFSKVEPVTGREFSFNDNSINVSAFTRIRLERSHIRDNSINASKLADFELHESQFSNCSINGSAIDTLEMNKAQLKEVSIQGSKFTKLSLIDQCSITDSKFEGCNLKTLNLKNRSRIQDNRLSGVQIANLELITSSLEDVSAQSSSFNDVILHNSHCADLKVTGMRFSVWHLENTTIRDCSITGKSGIRDLKWQNVRMMNSSLTDVRFENCRIENVNFVDVHLKDIKLRDLDIRDRTIRRIEDLHPAHFANF